ncbi:MAG: hypothetical protein CME15_01020 [Gemmatimonadetes bacterium]|nr:hypothetical protein [Gemmatimonadota bacterium]
MSLLDLYMLRRYSVCMVLSVLSLWGISFVVDLIENIDVFIDHEAELGQIARYYLYRTPYWVILTLPISSLLGTLFCLTGLARRSEVTAAKAAGISLYRLLLPVFASAAVFSGLAFLFTDLVIPPATYRYNSVRDEIRSYNRNDGSRRHVLLQDRDDQILFARSYDHGKRRAHQALYERFDGSKVAERAVGRLLVWRDSTWALIGAHRYALSGGAFQATALDTLHLPSIGLRPEDFARQQKKPTEMNYRELEAHIERTRANGEDATRHLVDLHLKISFPLTCLVIVVLGAPLAANSRRASRANSLGVGILICFVFYSCVKTGQALGWNEILSPWLGAWLANIGFGVLGLILLVRAHT